MIQAPLPRINALFHSKCRDKAMNSQRYSLEYDVIVSQNKTMNKPVAIPIKIVEIEHFVDLNEGGLHDYGGS